MNSKFRILLISFFLISGAILTLPRWAWSAAYDIQEITPEVKAALDNRRQRFDELQDLKRRGIVGENNQGYVQLLTEAHGYRDLVDAENSDRRVIYLAIIKQNNLAESEQGKVEAAFAQVQKDKANPGDKIQAEDGSWTTK